MSEASRDPDLVELDLGRHRRALTDLLGVIALLDPGWNSVTTPDAVVKALVLTNTDVCMDPRTTPLGIAMSTVRMNHKEGTFEDIVWSRVVKRIDKLSGALDDILRVCDAAIMTGWRHDIARLVVKALER